MEAPCSLAIRAHFEILIKFSSLLEVDRSCAIAAMGSAFVVAEVVVVVMALVVVEAME